MYKTRFTIKTLILAFIVVVAISCDDDNDSKPNLRTPIDYTALTATTAYSELFVDASGATTVDLKDGNQLHKMFQALNYQSTSAVSANTTVQSAKLKSQFSNSGSPFADIKTATIDVSGAELNTSVLKIKEKVASSKSSSEADAARARLETLFDEIQAASASVTTPASQGQAGKLGTYLVDAKGIEIAQIIQKSLIGALQFDYIANVLLDEGLDAENHELVSGKTYTELEHNWDMAYGLLTLNQVYLLNATNDVRGTVEFAAGSYIWEYNKDSYAAIHPAFLKGRAAIVNNDMATLEEQATFIRTAFEKAIASAAVGYLGKWKTGTTDADRAHAMGEGLGFIYSLRFLPKADAAFSDGLLTGLIGSTNGFWDLTADKINTASDAIKTKFGI